MQINEQGLKPADRLPDIRSHKYLHVYISIWFDCDSPRLAAQYASNSAFTKYFFSFGLKLNTNRKATPDHLLSTLTCTLRYNFKSHNAKCTGDNSQCNISADNAVGALPIN